MTNKFQSIRRIKSQIFDEEEKKPSSFVDNIHLDIDTNDLFDSSFEFHQDYYHLH